MKKILALLLCLWLLSPACLAEDGGLAHRFADAGEAAALLLANRDYYDGMNQNDLDFRMQKHGATLAELEAFAAAQTRDYTDAEMARVGQAMATIQQNCAERGYALPPLDGIVFAKTTMAEECGAGAYTHSLQVYLGEAALRLGLSDDPDARAWFDALVAHELFHCLTRSHPDFRAAMYGILGFTVAEDDFAFAPAIREAMIANPDVERHNAYAAFDIGGQPTNCVVLFTTARPFRQPGDSFFDDMVTGLVPIDDPSTLYTADDADNFWDVFGRNTDYVIDPEETLADNFSYTVVYGPDGRAYDSPEIIAAIDSLLKAGVSADRAA